MRGFPDKTPTKPQPHTKSVLSDHKKVGTRFIPSWLQHVELDEIRYVDFILPELFWLAALNDSHGWAKGAELALALPKAATKVSGQVGATSHECPALTSSYSALTGGQMREIVESLQSTGLLQAIRQALTPLVVLYPRCPLEFLFEEKSVDEDDLRTSLERHKSLLSSLFDRGGMTATRMQGNAVYIAFITGRLVVKKGLALANFPALEDFPRTEESRRVAASVRATVNVLAAHSTTASESSWASYFWNRGLELEPCDLHSIYDAHE